MIRKLVEYEIKASEREAVLATVEEFVASVRREEPGTEYRAFCVAEGNRFVHIMAFPDVRAEEAHRQAPYTLRFVEVLYPACSEKPRFSDIVEIP